MCYKYKSTIFDAIAPYIGFIGAGGLAVLATLRPARLMGIIEAVTDKEA